MDRTHAALSLLLGLTSCSSHPATPTDSPRGVTTAVSSFPAVDASASRAYGEALDLEPGSIRAFGLLLPVGTTEQYEHETTRMFYVQSAMPRVMRYLQRRLDITNADIHPLGAMIHNAHVRTAAGGENLFVDVGVRAEGERTLVTLWNRTALPVAPRTPEEGIRAAGFDPVTGRPLPENNR